MKNNSLNIQDYIHYWTMGGGETKPGQFNKDLYLRFLEHFNARQDG